MSPLTKILLFAAALLMGWSVYQTFYFQKAAIMGD